MRLATQCPFCQTTFRVAQDQLKLRGGLVRCGHCNEIFDGNAQLVSHAIAPPAAQPEQPVTPETWPVSHVKTSSDPAAPDVTLAALAPPPIAPPEAASATLSAALASIAANTLDAPWGVQDAPMPDAPPAPAVAAALATTVEAAAADAPAPSEQLATTAPPQELTDPHLPSAFVAHVDDAIHDGSSALRDTHSVAPASALSSVRAASTSTAVAAPAATADDAYEDNGDDAPSFVRQAERRERLRSVTRIVMGVGTVFLGITLLLQAIFYWRDTIAGWLPSTRPLLSSACAALDCAIDLPRNIDQLSLESSELQLVPPSQNIYTLSVLLRNRDYSAQAWPHLELTLNDDGENAIARRIFSPQDYLSSAQQISAGLAGEGEQQVKLGFELAQPPASGYRIYLFYP